MTTFPGAYTGAFQTSEKSQCSAGAIPGTLPCKGAGTGVTSTGADLCVCQRDGIPKDRGRDTT